MSLYNVRFFIIIIFDLFVYNKNNNDSFNKY